jgi:hypothetical protein
MNVVFHSRGNQLKEVFLSRNELDATCINLVQDRDQCRAFVVTIMNVLIKCSKFKQYTD